MGLRNVGAARFPNLVSDARYVLCIVFLDGRFVTPSENLRHAGVQVSVPRLDAKHRVILRLQTLEELNSLGFIQSLVLQVRKVLCRVLLRRAH